MVKFHGSQCGFCTPGFVMSLFSMFKNNKNYNSELIKDSISGNLCRCTGYRPIVDAGKSLNRISKIDQFSKNKSKVKPLGDGEGKFTKGMDMLVNKPKQGFGMRSWRYSAFIENGEVAKIFVEDGKNNESNDEDPFKVSDVNTMLKYLKDKK